MAGQRRLLVQWPAEKQTDSSADSPIRFTSVGKAAGIDFTYYGGPSPQHFMTEQNGGGVALFDFDQDGWLDLFFTNGSHFGRPAEQVGPTASQRLYRNVTGTGDGELRFEDVTATAGLTVFGFGMGCAAGDYDNNGYPDLFVCEYGRQRLWHNRGDGTFDDVTQPAGVADRASFFSETTGVRATWAAVDRERFAIRQTASSPRRIDSDRRRFRVVEPSWWQRLRIVAASL